MCFLCIQGPLGLLAGEDTWDARGLAWESSRSVHSASAKEMGTLGQRGRGGEGQSVLGASLSSSTQGGGSECRGPSAVLFMVLGAAPSPTQEGPRPWRAAGPLSSQPDEKPGEREGQPKAEPGMGGQKWPKGLARLGEWTGPGPRAGQVGETVESRVGSSTRSRLRAPEEGR